MENREITLDNYKELLPERLHSLYLEYVNTPSYTGANGEMILTEEEQLIPPSDDVIKKWNFADLIEHDPDYYFIN